MAEKIKENQFDEVGVNPFNAPIPGESLTSSPETPRAWERPPEYTDQDEAMMAVYMVLTEQDTLRQLVEIISEGVPLDEIAQVLLYKGYTQGKYTPDMMLMLAEPTIYLLIAIADYAEIKDYVLYSEEDEDPDTMIPEDDVTPVDMDGDGEPDTEASTKPIIKPDSLSKSLLSRVDTELESKVKEATTEEVEE
jgi:hypothetical protein